jgi:Animal haem peroxidase
MAGRYTRLFPEYRGEFADHDLEKLAHEMISAPEPPRKGELDPEEDPDIAAAYTYLGQFTDHDLTFDPTSRLREALTDQQLDALADFRTPRFDLDNLYGRGPDDQPYMYEPDKIHLLLGEPMPGNDFDPDAHDLPRGPNHRALIGDPRNDENRIVAQLHAIFLRFHNKVADHLGEQAGFEEVRNQVRWHYQWMLVTDYLPTVINHDTYQRVFADPYYPTPALPGLRGGLRLMPVEFSVAAFRFGHSMIRPEYQLNTKVTHPIFRPDADDAAQAGDPADLRGFRPIPSDWAIDWRFFIHLGPGARPSTHGQANPVPQKAYKIDTALVNPLGDLPRRIVPNPNSLALRNLQRGTAFSLPSGQQVARALGEEPIPDEDLVIGKAIKNGKRTSFAQIAGNFSGRAPLWAYILSEAQVTSWKRARLFAPKNGIPIKLGPVGGGIVAGVFAALLRGDPTSYLNQGAPFTPIPEFARGGEFGLAELINVALRPAR